MPIVQIQLSGTFWPETGSSSLHCQVQTQHFDLDPHETRIFHKRDTELLEHGGDPADVLAGMARFGLGRWTKLMAIWTPF